MSKSLAYIGAPGSRTIDVAFWIAECILLGQKIPTREQLRDRFHMSRASAYRWQRWAADRQARIDARNGDHEQD